MQKNTCKRGKGGSVIVKNNLIIGEGFNSPPFNLESQRRCDADKSKYHERVRDKTCCIHAEQRAILDTLKNNADKIIGSRIYYANLDDKGEIARAGNPYCTICSKITIEAGISEFVLWHKDGICVYESGEYNKLSFEYNG